MPLPVPRVRDPDRMGCRAVPRVQTHPRRPPATSRPMRARSRTQPSSCLRTWHDSRRHPATAAALTTAVRRTQMGPVKRFRQAVRSPRPAPPRRARLRAAGALTRTSRGAPASGAPPRAPSPMPTAPRAMAARPPAGPQKVAGDLGSAVTGLAELLPSLRSKARSCLSKWRSRIAHRRRGWSRLLRRHQALRGLRHTCSRRGLRRCERPSRRSWPSSCAAGGT